jgi:Zn-dependent protease
MRYTLRFGSYFGIPVKVHITFPLILIVFGLQAGIRGGWEEAGWAVLLVMAVFVCVVLHELGHSLQVKRYGITVRDIVLLPIGGMARAESIPREPRQEMIVAISGPLVNFALALLLLGVLMLRRDPIDFEHDFLANLFSINIVLGTFNLIPAFPMDGGRIMRGFLAMRMPYLRATHYAKNVGQAIAVLFVIIGFTKSTFILLPFIAVVIFFGAMSEENMVKMKYSLGTKSIKEFIPSSVPMLSMESSVESASAWFDESGVIALAVTDAGRRLPGAVLSGDIAEGVKDGKGHENLTGYLRTGFPLVEASAPALQVYSYLQAQKRPFAGVIENGFFLGLVTLSELSREVQ